MKYIVTKAFFRNVTNKYPKLLNKKSYRALFMRICFSQNRDEDTDRVLLPYEALWNMQPHLEGQRLNRNIFNAKQFLIDFQTDVLPKFDFTRAHYQISKCRQVKDDGLDAQDRQWLKDELSQPLEISEVEYINMVTEETYGRKNYTELRKTLAEEYQEDKKEFYPVLNQQQRLILDYLDEVKCDHLFSRKLTNNIDRVMQQIDKIPEEHKRERQVAIIQSIQENPQVYYQPSAKAHTARLSATNSVPLLRSEVRKAFCAGWSEVDLVSSQFAILAAKLNAPHCQEFIASNKNLWQELYRHTHGQNEAPPKELKGKFKQLMYSICFGKAKQHKEGYREMCIQKGKPMQNDLMTECNNYNMLSLLEHPLIVELLEKRDQWHSQIREDQGALDCFGFHHQVSSERWVGQVGGTIIQAIELDIISGAFQCAKEYGESYQFTIPFFQHDGFALSTNNKAKEATVIDLLQQYVSDRAKKHSVTAKLEITRL